MSNYYTVLQAGIYEIKSTLNWGSVSLPEEKLELMVAILS